MAFPSSALRIRAAYSSPRESQKNGSEQGGAGGSGCRRLRRNAGCRVTDRRKKDGLKRSRMNGGSTSECCRNRQECMRRVIRRAKVSSSCSVGNSDSVDSDNSGCVDWSASSIMKGRGRRVGRIDVGGGRRNPNPKSPCEIPRRNPQAKSPGEILVADEVARAYRWAPIMRHTR